MAQVFPLYQDANPMWKVIDEDRYKFYLESNGDEFYYDFATNKKGKDERFEFPVNKTKTKILNSLNGRKCCEFCGDEVDVKEMVVIGWDGCMAGVLNAPTCKECYTYHLQHDEEGEWEEAKPNGKIQVVRLVPRTATIKATGEKVFVSFDFE